MTAANLPPESDQAIKRIGTWLRTRLRGPDLMAYALRFSLSRWDFSPATYSPRVTFLRSPFRSRQNRRDHTEPRGFKHLIVFIPWSFPSSASVATILPTAASIKAHAIASRRCSSAGTRPIRGSVTTCGQSSPRYSTFRVWTLRSSPRSSQLRLAY